MDVGRCATAIVAAEGWVVLGRQEAEGGQEASLVVAGGDLRGQAVLTVRSAGFPSGTPPDWVESSHLPRWLPPPDGPRARRDEIVVGLREHPGRGTLADVLASTDRLSAGEAVTVLAAVARGVSALHAAGRGGIRLFPADVGFRHDGCPVLTAVDDVRELDQRTMGEDVVGFAELARALCETDQERGAIVLAAATDRGHRSWEDVIAGVLRAADPTAVRWVERDAPPVSDARARGDPARRGPVPRGSAPTGAALTGATPAGASPTGRAPTGPAPTGRAPTGPARPGPARRGSAPRGSAPTGSAPASATEPRERRDGTGGRDILGVLERALDALGDRPVAHAVAAARDWVATRPRVVAVACSPLVALVVVLMVVPVQDGPS